METLKDYRREFIHFKLIFEDFQKGCSNILNYIGRSKPSDLVISWRKTDLVFPWENKKKILNYQPTCYEIILDRNKKRVIIEVRISGYISVRAQIVDPSNSLEFTGIECVHKLPKKIYPYISIFYNKKTDKNGITLTQEEFHALLPKVFEFLSLK